MTYEYACSSCGHEWEAEQSITEKPLKKCPSCKKNTATRQISGGLGFVLKGGGWYADGYGSAAKSSGKSDAAESSGESKSEASESKKSSDKTDASKSSKPSDSATTKTSKVAE